MSTVLSQSVSGVVVRPKLREMREVLMRIEAKRQADLIRFRTCCADPRASK